MAKKKKQKILEAELTGHHLTNKETGQVYEQALVPIGDAEAFRTQDDHQNALVGKILTKVRAFFKTDTSDAEDEKTTDTPTGGMASGGLVAQAYYDRMEMEHNRNALYSDWLRMDRKSVIARKALNVTISNAFPPTMGDETCHTIVSDQDKVETILDELDKRVKMNHFVPKWARTTCQFGDSFIERVVDNDALIVRLKWLNPFYMYRNEDEYGRLQTEKAFTMKDDQEVIGEFAFFQVGHTRYDQDLSSIYGTSFYFPGRFPYRQREMMDEGLVIRRLIKSSKRYAYYIEVPQSATPEQKKKIIDEVKHAVRRRKIADTNGKINLNKTPAIEEEDLFIPIWKDSSARVEMFDSGSMNDDLNDVLYFRDGEIVAYGVPPGHLGLDKEGRGRAQLSWADIQFARTTRVIQKMMAGAQREVYDLQLVLQGMAGAEYKIVYPAISFVDERLKQEVEEIKWRIVTQARTMIGVPMNWLLRNIIGLSEDEAEELLTDADYKDGGTQMGQGFGQGEPTKLDVQNAIFTNSRLMSDISELRNKVRYVIQYGLNKELES